MAERQRELVERLDELADVALSEVAPTHPYTAVLMAEAMREAAAALLKLEDDYHRAMAEKYISKRPLTEREQEYARKFATPKQELQP